MKPTQAWTAFGGALLAGALITGCTPDQGGPQRPPASTHAPAAPASSQTPLDDCEDADFAEGDWLADCLGLGNPEDENDDDHGVVPGTGSHRTTPSKPGKPTSKNTGGKPTGGKPAGGKPRR